MPIVGQDPLPGAGPADGRVLERLQQLSERVGHPERVGVDQYDDLAERLPGGRPSRRCAAGDLCPRPPNASEVVTDALEGSLRGPLITTSTSSGCWSQIRLSTSRNRVSGSSTTGITTVVVGV